MTVPYIHLPQAYVSGGTDAGDPMHEFYKVADQRFPVLPDDIYIHDDTPAGSWGLAWYYGLDTYGRPRFAVRDDVTLNSKIGWHESGHAFEDVVTKLLMGDAGKPADYFRDGYWEFRDFPGTWQEAMQMAVSIPGGGAWQFFPGESVAEAFSAAVNGTVESEWTATYGKDLALDQNGNYSPVAGAMQARAFFLDMMEEAYGDMTPEQDQMLRRVLAILEAREPLVWTAREQRLIDVETGKPFNPNANPIDPRIRVP